MIFGCHHDIDGILLLKKNHKISKEETESRVINCTKGDWNSRLANFRTLYGHIPTSIQQNVSQLEKIRKLRNEVGHAFGRNIEQAKRYEVIEISAMHKLPVNTFLRYHKLLYDIAREVDAFLLNTHIGNYEPLFHLHNIYDTIAPLNKGQKMITLKKSMGNEVKGQFSKDFCRQVIMYYENL